MNGKKKNRKKKADTRQTISERRIHSIARNYLIFLSKKYTCVLLSCGFLRVVSKFTFMNADSLAD